jgi:hypothetical protein
MKLNMSGIHKDLIKFAKKNLNKLEFKTLPKVTYHVQRYHAMSLQEREGFQHDFN